MDEQRMADGISVELLNDFSDQSSITVGNVRLASCNDLDIEELPDGTVRIDHEQQQEIHNTIKWIALVISDYRNGKLVYKE